MATELTKLAYSRQLMKTRTLTSLVTGASTAVVAITSIAVLVAVKSPLAPGLHSAEEICLLIVLTTTCTLLVMSLLYGDLNRLYARVAASEQRAIADARTDALTGLANRRFLTEQLTERCSASIGSRSEALLFFDLDHFKRVNDLLGHAAGDEVILQIASKLRSSQPDAVVARLGGDEFALIVDFSSEAQLREQCAQLCTTLSGIYRLTSGDVTIGVSIGAVPLERGIAPAEAMHRADIAMYCAKSVRGGYHVFDEAMLAASERRANVGNRLREALREGEGLSSLYQTLVGRDGEVVAVEALLRWNDAELGIIAPAEIVAVAEEACLVEELGKFMAEQACQAARELPEVQVCLNVSAVQLLDPQFPDRLLSVVRERQLNPAQFALEVSERIFVERGEQVAPNIERLKGSGFQLAIDNFGTSASSISHVHKLGVGMVKLDRTLLESTREFGSIAIMRAKVGLAHSLGMQVVCCGVADRQDKAIALEAGCNILQGFLISTPAVLSEVLSLVDRKAPLKVAV